MVKKQFLCFDSTLSSWNYKVPFIDCRIAQTGSYHFLVGGKVILEQNEVVFMQQKLLKSIQLDDKGQLIQARDTPSSSPLLLFSVFPFPFLLFIIVSKNKKICFRHVLLWEQCDLGPSIHALLQSFCLGFPGGFLFLHLDNTIRIKMPFPFMQQVHLLLFPPVLGFWW